MSVIIYLLFLADRFQYTMGESEDGFQLPKAFVPDLQKYFGIGSVVHFDSVLS
mgnify:CR=1 FL=1